MAIGSGLAHQLGWVTEVTYGTPVTVTKFLPVTKCEIKKVKNVQTGDGLTSGDYLQRGAQREVGTLGATGDIEFEIPNKGAGLLFQALMGTTVTPVIVGAGPGYTQTHTLANPFGKFLTMQTGVPDLTGTVRPYTITGAKVTDAEFTCEPGAEFTCALTVDGQTISESPALATASYPASLSWFPGTNIGIKVGTFNSETTVTGVTKATVKISRPSKTDRYYLNGAGLKAEPILNDKAGSITGTISADFIDKTKFADVFAADTSFSLVLEAIGAVITGTFETFRITLPQCFLDGDTPVVDGPDVVNGDFPFTCYFDGTNQPFITIISTDVTI